MKERALYIRVISLEGLTYTREGSRATRREYCLSRSGTRLSDGALEVQVDEAQLACQEVTLLGAYYRLKVKHVPSTMVSRLL